MYVKKELPRDAVPFMKESKMKKLLGLILGNSQTFRFGIHLTADNIDKYRDDNDSAQYDLLKVRRNTHQVTAVTDDGDHHGAHQGTPYVSFTTQERSSADDTGCDGVRITFQRSQRNCRIQTSHVDDTGHGAEESGSGITEDLNAVCIDTGQSGCLTVSAEGKDFPAQSRSGQENGA